MQELRVGVVGFGWMGQVHSRAFDRLRHHYPDVATRARLVGVADPSTDPALRRTVESYGCTDLVSDWRDLVARPDIDLVCVASPNDTHHDVAIAAVEAGKHLWIEKPAGRDAGETRAIADAVRAHGVQSAAGFNYRNAPAIERARELVASGELGRVQHVRVRFCADYSAHPEGALSWRFQRAHAGSGVLGDLASHAVDLVHHVVGGISEVIADVATFIPERPMAASTASHFSRGTGPRGQVENEDYVNALLRLGGGALGSLEACRTEVGEQCAYTLSVHGDRGALSWDFRRMGELQVCLGQSQQDASYSTMLVTSRDGELSRFQPGAGLAMSYDDLKVIEAHRLVTSIVTGEPAGATIHDAAAAADVVAAMQLSADQQRWIRL